MFQAAGALFVLFFRGCLSSSRHARFPFLVFSRCSPVAVSSIMSTASSGPPLVPFVVVYDLLRGAAGCVVFSLVGKQMRGGKSSSEPRLEYCTRKSGGRFSFNKF